LRDVLSQSSALEKISGYKLIDLKACVIDLHGVQMRAMSSKCKLKVTYEPWPFASLLGADRDAHGFLFVLRHTIVGVPPEILIQGVWKRCFYSHSRALIRESYLPIRALWRLHCRFDVMIK
jgi:hypothetical protein